MKRYKQIIIFIFSSLLISACGGGVGDYDTGTTPATLDTTAPVFTSGDPTGNVTEACSVTAQFDEPIAAATVTSTSFVIIDSNSTTLTATDGTWGLDPSSATVIKFVPLSALPTGTTSVTVTTAITDVAGNNLAADQQWTFTTTLPCAP